MGVTPAGDAMPALILLKQQRREEMTLKEGDTEVCLNVTFPERPPQTTL